MTKKPLNVTQEQMEYVDLVYGQGTAKRYIDAGVFVVNPDIHGLFAYQGFYFSRKDLVTFREE